MIANTCSMVEYYLIPDETLDSDRGCERRVMMSKM